MKVALMSARGSGRWPTPACSSARIGGDVFVTLMVDTACSPPQGKVGIFDELLTEMVGLAQ